MAMGALDLREGTDQAAHNAPSGLLNNERAIRLVEKRVTRYVRSILHSSSTMDMLGEEEISAWKAVPMRGNSNT